MAAECNGAAPITAAALFEKHKLLREAIPPLVREVLEADELNSASEAFDGDASFLKFLAAKISIAGRKREMMALISQTTLEPRGNGVMNFEALLSHQRSMRSALDECTAWLEQVQTSKIAALPEGAGGEDAQSQVMLPRFVRLIRRLDLTEKEVRALEYIAVHQCMGDRIREQRATVELAVYSGLNPCELIHFASKQRAHMKQGLLSEVSLGVADGERHLDEELAGLPCNRATLSAEAAKALAGGQLSVTEMLKLDEGGALAVTLREEGKDALPADASAARKRPADLLSVSGTDLKRPKGGLEMLGKLMQAGAMATLDGEAGLEMPMEGEGSDDEELDDDLGGVRPGDDVLSALMFAERRRDKRRSKALAEVPVEAAAESEQPEGEQAELAPYSTDLEYLVDAVELVSRKGRLHQVKQKMEDKKGSADGDEDAEDGPAAFAAPWERRRDDPQKDRRRSRELEGQIKQISRQIEERMRLTREAAAGQSKSVAWVPRLERILSSRQMNDFEKEVVILLVGLILLPNKLVQVTSGNCPSGYRIYRGKAEGIDVASILSALSPDLASQISNRKSFYKDAVLVRDNIVHVGSKGVRGDLASCPVEIDRRMVDFIVGLDSEVHQLVDGSHLYMPQTKMDAVVLPEDSKTLITKTVKSFALFRRSKSQFSLGDTISSTGLVMLFYGDSGTGKTMTANAIANVLGKKVLLINFPSLGGEQAADVVRMIFRESKINDAVLFFDECESIFESRERSRGRDVNMLLTELERHDGMIILATNRPFDLDEAMHRRITLAIEFHKPDHILRREIWKRLLPPGLPLADNVDPAALAMRYELSGGFIKNAILTALSIACSRAEESQQAGKAEEVRVTQDDLAQGAQLQLRGRLAMRSFERRIVPKSGLETLVCSQNLRKRLQDVVDFEKSKTVLYGQWGFGGRAAFSGGQPEIGSCVLFYGPPGTGKSLAAQAIGFEVGRPLKVVNAANVLDKYVGETGKNIEKVFAEARAMEAILVFDEAEGLFGRRSSDAASSVDKHSNLDSGLLLYWLEHYPGLCILTTNTKDAIDSAFFRRFRFMVEFPQPDRATRAKLWASCLPAQAPRAADVDFQALASEFEKFAGGDIQNAVIRAASRAALRPEKDGKRQICMADLREAARTESSKADDALQRLYM